MTESVLLDDSQSVRPSCGASRTWGAAGLDDFAPGSSSLSSRHRFPLDILKIDRSSLERLNHTSNNAELAWTIIRLGQRPQLVTVAEKIEDSAQFLALRLMGCDIGHGDHFSRPMASEEISRLVGDELTAARGSSTPR
jgi:EAL domain-containing protein (putative c-di-GMP-specific phosphodiesterase class I)